MTQMNGKSPVITGSATGTAPVGTKQGKDAPTAVLIGVTGGLGQALARLLAAEGFRLVLAARREHDPAALTGQSDGSAIYQSADVTDPASLEKLASAAFGHLGRIDAVVNLAGLSPRKAIEEYTSAVVDDMLAVNVKGPISVTQAFLPGLRKQAGGGVVVHLGGCMDGRVALPFMSAYAATRGAWRATYKAPTASLPGPTWCFPSSGLCHPTPSRSPHFSTCGARWESPLPSPT
jgi:NAD(P)-dependent dehydrogenase (short-subunit alcohol dehydrogenase family)